MRELKVEDVARSNPYVDIVLLRKYEKLKERICLVNNSEMPPILGPRHRVKFKDQNESVYPLRK